MFSSTASQKKNQDHILLVGSLKRLRVEGWQVCDSPPLTKEKIILFSSSFDYPISYKHLISKVCFFLHKIAIKRK